MRRAIPLCVFAGQPLIRSWTPGPGFRHTPVFVPRHRDTTRGSILGLPVVTFLACLCRKGHLPRRAMTTRSDEVALPTRLREAASSVLLESTDTVAVCGLQPVLPGHTVLVAKSLGSRLSQLSEDAMLDLWRTALRAQVHLERELATTASNWAVFDGWFSGQPVAQVHLHVVPRKSGDLDENDQVYAALEAWTPWPAGGALQPPPIAWPADEHRKERTGELMAQEAGSYRTGIEGHGSIPEEQAQRESSQARSQNLRERYDNAAQLERSHIFFASPSGLSVAFVNLKPLVPGHVLVTPRRVAPRLADLSEEEFDDLFRTVRLVQAVVERHYGAEASRLGIQDGPDAGQSVPHVHVRDLQT
ncbi:aph1 [Symbiodinium sp. CCMP2592]|nr:aph1 [Symbiodinium sp. CCMP2592]